LWWSLIGIFFLYIYLQLQFVCIFIHQFQLLFRECNYPKSFMVWIGLHGVMFLFLFSDFYKSKYTSDGKRRPANDGACMVWCVITKINNIIVLGRSCKLDANGWRRIIKSPCNSNCFCALLTLRMSFLWRWKYLYRSLSHFLFIPKDCRCYNIRFTKCHGKSI